MKDKLDKQIWARVDAATHEAFASKCKEVGIPVSAMVRMLIIKFLKEDIDINEK